MNGLNQEKSRENEVQDWALKVSPFNFFFFLFPSTSIMRSCNSVLCVTFTLRFVMSDVLERKVREEDIKRRDGAFLSITLN